MMRWLCGWLAERAWRKLRHTSIRPEGQPYIERYDLGPIFGFGVLLHEYVGNDAERWLHNHPWRWAVGIPLTGGYTEERLVHMDPFTGLGIRARTIGRFFPNLILSTDFHRIISTKRGTWTLFIYGKRLGGWGFLHSSYDTAECMYSIGVEQRQENTRVKTRKELGLQ